jgi:hypothetical protein
MESFRKTLLVVSVCLCGQLPSAFAEDALARIRACAAEKDDARRLACFDQEVRGLTPVPPRAAAAAAAPGAPAAAGASARAPASAATPVAASATAPSSAPARAPENQFGMNPALAQQQSKDQGAQPPKVRKLNGHVAAASRNALGNSIITLDNGEVWKEAEVTSHLPFNPGDPVTIKQGLLGSFWLYTDKVPSVRVTRVR